MTQVKNRSHCFTINNYTQNDISSVKTCECDYIVWAYEVGEKCKTPHIQGYIYISNKISIKALNKRLGNRANIKVCDGSPEQNRTYIVGPYHDQKTGKTKPFNPEHTERGKLPRQGKRTDLEKCAKMIKKKKPMREIFEKCPGSFIRYHKGIESAKQLYQTDRTEKPRVIWIAGPAGVGKSRSVYDSYKSVYTKDGTKWWNGYDQHECILVDDYDCQWPFRDLLRFLDRYPYQGQTKGGYVKINSPTIIFTCDKSLEEAYEHLPPHEFAQLKRRFTELRYLDCDI